jgi:hypothetical protein
MLSSFCKEQAQWGVLRLAGKRLVERFRITLAVSELLPVVQPEGYQVLK